MRGVLACTSVLLCCVLVSCGKTQFGGVNLSGAEFGNNVPGTYNSDYTYPNNAEVDYYVNKGMNLFRLPFLWERLQRSQFASFDSTEQGRLTSLVNYITNTKGKYVLLDPHNYARYYGQVIGQGVPVTAFADFWKKLATLFKSNDKVLFGLMNEPKDMDSTLWASNAQAAITAIRSTGAGNLITVPGNGYTGAWSWTPANAWYGTANSIALAGITDPMNNFIFEVHQYLDGDSSGTNAACTSNNIGSQRIMAFTNWARQNGKRAMLGEFGGGNSGTCLAAIDDILNYMESNSDVWVGWQWWGAGPWWGGYFMSIEPDNGQDKPQMSAVSRHLPCTGPVSGSTTARPATTATPPPATTTAVSMTTGRVPSATTTGSSSSKQPSCNSGVPTRPDSAAFSQAPFMIPNSGSATVIMAYSLTTTRVIIVDLMSSTGAATWYVKGVATVQPGTGTVSITVNIQNTPPMGPNFMFHAWVVSTSDYNNRGDPWNYALSSVNAPVSIAGSGTVAMYSQDVSPCEDQQACIDVCGSADNINTCDCNSDGKVTVLCTGTEQPVVNAAYKTTTSASTLTILSLCAAVLGLCSWL